MEREISFLANAKVKRVEIISRSALHEDRIAEGERERMYKRRLRENRKKWGSLGGAPVVAYRNNSGRSSLRWNHPPPEAPSRCRKAGPISTLPIDRKCTRVAA